MSNVQSKTVQYKKLIKLTRPSKRNQKRMCFGSLLKRRKSQNQKIEDYEDDVFVMELKDASNDSRPANFTASQSADRLICEVKLFSRFVIC